MTRSPPPAGVVRRGGPRGRIDGHPAAARTPGCLVPDNVRAVRAELGPSPHRSVFPEGPGVSDRRVDFSEPCDDEYNSWHDVGYTNKSHAANELAVIPVASLGNR